MLKTFWNTSLIIQNQFEYRIVFKKKNNNNNDMKI